MALCGELGFETSDEICHLPDLALVLADRRVQLFEVPDAGQVVGRVDAGRHVHLVLWDLADDLSDELLELLRTFYEFLKDVLERLLLLLVDVVDLADSLQDLRELLRAVLLEAVELRQDLASEALRLLGDRLPSGDGCEFLHGDLQPGLIRGHTDRERLYLLVDG